MHNGCENHRPAVCTSHGQARPFAVSRSFLGLKHLQDGGHSEQILPETLAH
jgi:hypothetical protein